MTTIGAHKILITTAIVFSIPIGAWGVLRWVRHGETMGLAVTAGAVAAALTLGVYLRSFLGRHRGES
jgi:hypothetical protein